MTRVLSGLVLIVLVLGGVLLMPAWATTLLALVALVPAVFELAQISESGHRSLPRLLMYVAAASAMFALGAGGVRVEVVLLAAMLTVGAMLVGEARPDTDVLRRTGVMLLPVLYLGLPLGALVAIRYQHGPVALLLLLATTVVSDTAQYYGGRLWGQRPLAPRISPKKTLEGAVTGIVAGSLVLPLAAPLAGSSMPVWTLWAIGLTVVALGITGDLFESLLKRSAGVKDSSQLIPGHGGVLDRIDSLLFAGPFYYVVLRGGWA